MLKYIENGRDFPSQSVHEKETICNQYEPSRVFGTGIKFLKTRYFEKEEGKQFMRMSWFCRGTRLTEKADSCKITFKNSSVRCEPELAKKKVEVDFFGVE